MTDFDAKWKRFLKAKLKKPTNKHTQKKNQKNAL